jgi:hypothetical protein
MCGTSAVETALFIKCGEDRWDVASRGVSLYLLGLLFNREDGSDMSL